MPGIGDWIGEPLSFVANYLSKILCLFVLHWHFGNPSVSNYCMYTEMDCCDVAKLAPWI